MHNKCWSKNELDADIERGPHKSAKIEAEFLSKEFVDMINTSQWVILTYSAAQKLPHLHIYI